MKSYIDKDGCLHIEAENEQDAFILHAWSIAHEYWEENREKFLHSKDKMPIFPTMFGSIVYDWSLSE